MGPTHIDMSLQGLKINHTLPSIEHPPSTRAFLTSRTMTTGFSQSGREEAARSELKPYPAAITITSRSNNPPLAPFPSTASKSAAFSPVHAVDASRKRLHNTPRSCLCGTWRSASALFFIPSLRRATEPVGCEGGSTGSGVKGALSLGSPGLPLAARDGAAVRTEPPFLGELRAGGTCVLVTRYCNSIANVKPRFSFLFFTGAVV